jgi:hypothetical protein
MDPKKETETEPCAATPERLSASRRTAGMINGNGHWSIVKVEEPGKT